MYCEEKLSRGQIARQFGASVMTVTRQLSAAGITFEARVGDNPNAGRTPERQAEINEKVSANRKGKGTGPRVQHETRVCQNDECKTSYEFRPGKTGTQFCSKSCQMAVQARRTATEAREQYEASPRRCPCGDAIPYEYRHSRQYCSPEHRSEYQVRRTTDPSKHVTITCQHPSCGRQVQRYKGYGNGHLKYCSNACARTHTKTRHFYAIEDFDIVFESSWEALFWGLCAFRKLPVERFDREQGVEWQSGSWYAPDFWVPSLELAVEVKGQPDEDDPVRWEKFGRPLVVLGHEEMNVLLKSDDLTTALRGIATITKP